MALRPRGARRRALRLRPGRLRVPRAARHRVRRPRPGASFPAEAVAERSEHLLHKGFGSQGEAPSHPEMLDWLAHQYQTEYRWSTKFLLKNIVKSNEGTFLISLTFGDIKPDNVMYSPIKNKFVFTDFGISRFIHE